MKTAGVGIDLGGTKLLIICGDESYRVPSGPDFSPAQMEEVVRGFLENRDIQPTSVGISVPGFVDRKGNIGVCDVLPLMSGWRPSEVFGDLGCRVVAINDANAALVEEMHDAREGTTAGVIMVGTAVGAAFMVEGVPLIGTTGLAGELGYLPLCVDGTITRLDELAGGSFLAKKLNVDGRALAELAHKRDDAALSVIRASGSFLGLALATVINLLNPSRIALGGGTIALPGYFAAVMKTAGEHSIPEMWRACAVTHVRTGEKVAALGALRWAERS